MEFVVELSDIPAVLISVVVVVARAARVICIFIGSRWLYAAGVVVAVSHDDVVVVDKIGKFCFYLVL